MRRVFAMALVGLLLEGWPFPTKAQFPAIERLKRAYQACASTSGPLCSSRRSLKRSPGAARASRLASVALRTASGSRRRSSPVIATPTVMLTPHVMTEEVGPEKFWARNRNIVHNLVPANYLTLCAATLPVGLDRLGMPVGLQFIAKGGDDERLVAIACAAERVLGTPREILGAPPMCKG
jgi:Asp-tRNA(Asn)/Glu-tRNA(Gln) amidotransferase A subunit family amidase